MISERIAAVLRAAPVVDGHNDLPWELRQRGDEVLDLTTDLSATGLHTDLPRLTAGGVGAQFWSVFVPCALPGPAAVQATLEQIAAVYRLIDQHPDRLALA